MDISPVRPHNREEAIKWNYYMKGEDFFPIKDWPWSLQRIAIKKKLNYMERMNFLIFLIKNGLEPEIARRWIHYHRQFDNAAINQINAIIQNHERYHYGYWDMIERRYVNSSK